MPYRDASGVNLQSQALVFRVMVPEGRAAGCGGELRGAGEGRARGVEGGDYSSWCGSLQRGKKVWAYV